MELFDNGIGLPLLRRSSAGGELNFVPQRSDAAEKFNSVVSRDGQNENWSQSERAVNPRRWPFCLNECVQLKIKVFGFVQD